MASSSKNKISASAEDLFLPAEVAVLLTDVRVPDSDATGSDLVDDVAFLVLGRLEADDVPGQTCLTMQLLCIIREQVSFGQGRQPALSLDGQ